MMLESLNTSLMSFINYIIYMGIAQEGMGPTRKILGKNLKVKTMKKSK